MSYLIVQIYSYIQTLNNLDDNRSNLLQRAQRPNYANVLKTNLHNEWLLIFIPLVNQMFYEIALKTRNMQRVCNIGLNFLPKSRIDKLFWFKIHRVVTNFKPITYIGKAPTFARWQLA